MNTKYPGVSPNPKQTHASPLLIEKSRSAISLCSGGFTLTEIVVVIVVIAILLTVTVPGLTGALNSTRLASAGSLVGSVFEQAQQIASSRGRPVEVRFYKSNTKRVASSQPRYDSLLIMTHYAAGESDPSDPAVALGTPLSMIEGEGMATLPEAVAFMEGSQFSSILESNNTRGGGDEKADAKQLRSGRLEAYDLSNLAADYRSFLFLPESTNLLSNEKWFVTLVSDNAAGSGMLPKNFVTIQVNPVTAKITTYRP